MIVQAVVDDDHCFVSLRHGDCEGWETAAVVEEEVVVVLRRDGVGVDDNTTKERVHIHDAEHHEKEVRSAVGQSEGADDCPLVGGVVQPRGGEVWDNHQQQQSLGRNTFGTFRWSSMEPEEVPLRSCELLPT